MVGTRSQLSRASNSALDCSTTTLDTTSSSCTTRPTISSLSDSISAPIKQQLQRSNLKNHQENYEPAQSANELLQEEEVDSEDDGKEMLKWGYILLVGSTFTFAVGTWSIAIGPHVDTAGLGLLDSLARDTYYKYLIILLIPVTTCYVIINWWGLKIFRHA